MSDFYCEAMRKIVRNANVIKQALPGMKEHTAVVENVAEAESLQEKIDLIDKIVEAFPNVKHGLEAIGTGVPYVEAKLIRVITQVKKRGPERFHEYGFFLDDGQVLGIIGPGVQEFALEYRPPHLEARAFPGRFECESVIALPEF